MALSIREGIDYDTMEEQDATVIERAQLCISTDYGVL